MIVIWRPNKPVWYGDVSFRAIPMSNPRARTVMAFAMLIIVLKMAPLNTKRRLFDP